MSIHERDMFIGELSDTHMEDSSSLPHLPHHTPPASFSISLPEFCFISFAKSSITNVQKKWIMHRKITLEIYQP
jgi:hypothetical protein